MTNEVCNDSGNIFNKAYAAKLYEFSNDHKDPKDYDELLVKYNNMLKEITGDDPGWMPYTCLDPITALSVLNRDWDDNNRKKICEKLENIFGHIETIPDSFASIPKANNQNSACIWGSKKPDSNLDGKLIKEYQ